MICELPDYYDEKRVKARKPHRCCETGRWIQPGEHYYRCWGKWEGEFKVFKQCESAYHFARYLNLDLIGECAVGFGDITDLVSEYDDYENPWLVSTWRRICDGELRWGSDGPAEVDTTESILKG